MDVQIAKSFAKSLADSRKVSSRSDAGELLLRGSFEEGVVRTAAESFLLNPANDIGRTIFDRDITRLYRTEKHHGLSVHEGDVREINRNHLRGGHAGQQALDFWNIFLSQLSTQPQLEVVTIFSIWSDLQHDYQPQRQGDGQCDDR